MLEIGAWKRTSRNAVVLPDNFHVSQNLKAEHRLPDSALLVVSRSLSNGHSDQDELATASVFDQLATIADQLIAL